VTNIIETKNLTKIFNGKEVVSNVNMRVKKGEIYGFLGPNGAGKTTLMKMLTNLVKPTSGTIELFNEELTNHSYELLRRMGSIIEYPVFYERLSAEENLRFHCEYMGYHDHAAIKNAFELVNLRNTEGKVVKDFSLGMKQRLGIARAIITKPEILILDEPINGLDPVGIKEIRSLLQTLSREYGITILISSHILGEIELIADTIGVISDGRLVKEVSMEDIQSNQADYLEIVTSNIKKAIFVLENKLHISNYQVMDGSLIRVFDTNVNQSEISKMLIVHDIDIHSIGRKSHSLEDYFLTLINGGGKSA
jgi:ABC-2 type transport system ATP-binding protein